MPSQRTGAVAALIATMFIWGSSAVFLRTTALALAPENALALRYVLMVMLVAAGLSLTHQWRMARRDLPRFAITALGMFGSSWFSMQGFARVAAGLGTVIMMVEPIIIALLAHVALREPLSARIWMGLGISIAGAMVLFLPELGAAADEPANPLGIAALLCACAGWGVYTIGAKPLLMRYSAFAITSWSMLLSAPLVLLLASRPYDELLRTTPAASWLEILYLAVFNSIVGSILWNYGTRHLPGASVGSFLYLVPVVAVAAGYFWLGEPITLFLVVGGIITLLGVAVAQSDTSAH
jgi:drug/metabolite transporter (DMT)-like permease